MNNDKYLFFVNSYHKELVTGWYFSDEAEQANGPYPTKDKARQAFKEYCEYYL